MISDFARKNHFNWSIGHDWINIQSDGYACSFYETGFNIYITYTYFTGYPNKVGIAVNRYTDVKNSQ